MSRAMLLAELLPDVAGIPAELVVTGLVQDSRQVHPGDAFVAVLPARQEVPSTHGLNFAAQARAAGASAILFEPPAPANIAVPADAIVVPNLVSRMGEMADRFHGEPSRAMSVVGVTGTNGKTSTVQLLAQAWTLQGRRAGTIGTLGAGLYGEAVPTGFTTPLVLQVHALLANLRDAGADAVAMEVSSHALDQGRTDHVRFEVAAFTNLTRDHLDYHGDMDAYASAKAKLFAWPGLRAAVLNLDDAFGRELFASLPASVRGIGVSAAGRDDAAIRAENLRLDGNGIGFDFVVDGVRHRVASPLLGRFNADNLLAVAGVLHAFGAASDAIASLLSKLQPIHGRMNRLGGNGRPVVVVDYAHTPDALEQALSSLRAHAHGRLLCVFGCGGERDAGKRPQMAAIAERLADGVIVTDDNPRGEDGDAIVADILRGFADASRVIVERDRARAIGLAVDAANADDIVLVAGKGHEPYQEVAGVRHPFDDTAIAKAALERRA
ncbi:UDP-N-acetylmuramoyl-L-alanyl-D-glutamate--2,6-diaminopimelate ligase [Pseudoluteimonas lycopersici]|uniref:UDP-N-acetylmuramoyl-L-alanyl-D-glutamate--2,6-diaminopimelate ligase n=1 Tax=Pseudoluteimonas lycopersici TaxID=1324796 RepID=A0A516V7H3_9GAMM|nr:UDP-N-acetylmuramoyl-L-alanyl-D-glutamate--2,6-diaminopimelate ligase [Lysobacter lycopersici]QDQ74492.1 UDP-N-acetylmuramoyl-L-alanyl-D-glutamate--2,6-diaminopimelate ligase [Lysobacter lycopersici]